MAFCEAKFIVVLTAILGLNFTNTNKKYVYIHKGYSFILMVMLFTVSSWSMSGKLKIKKNVGLLVELLSSVIGLLTIMTSIIHGVFWKNKKIQHLRKSVEKYLESPDLEENYKLQQTTYLKKFIIANIIFAILCPLFMYTAAKKKGWSISKYFIIDVINVYTIAMVTMHLNNSTLFIVFASKTVNKMLTNLMNPFKKGSNEEVQEIKTIAKFHIVLCDLIHNLNKFIGLRVLLILFYMSLQILQCVEVMRHEEFSNFVVTAPKIIKMSLSCSLLIICIVLVSNCQTITKETQKMSVTSFKMLLENQPIDDEKKFSKVNLISQELYTLALQTSQNRPVFCAAGFFTMDYPMLYDMIATIIAYIVILIQLSSSD